MENEKPDKAALALERFLDGYNCAQSVFCPFCADAGLDEKAALKLATAFGGGISRKGNLCGCVTGGLMALGLMHGQETPPDGAKKTRDYDFFRAYTEAFAAKHGSLLCRELLGHDMSTPEGMEAVNAQNLTKKLCRDYVQSAVKIVEEMAKKGPGSK